MEVAPGEGGWGAVEEEGRGVDEGVGAHGGGGGFDGWHEGEGVVKDADGIFDGADVEGALAGGESAGAGLVDDVFDGFLVQGVLSMVVEKMSRLVSTWKVMLKRRRGR